MKFEFFDLKEEYKNYEQELRMNMSEKLLLQSDIDAYIKKQILRRARTLYNYKLINELIEKGAPLESILMAHKSTKERNGNLQYYSKIEKYFSNVNTVMDIGCGLNPLMVVSEFPDIEKYYCIEKDEKILKILGKLNSEFCCGKLELIKSDFSEDTGCLKDKKIDFLFVQKLIPTLIKKYRRRVLDNIVSINTKYMLVTGSKKSLSRTVSIEEEERIAINKFITTYNLKINDFFDKENEFGWVITKDEKI